MLPDLFLADLARQRHSDDAAAAWRGANLSPRESCVSHWSGRVSHWIAGVGSGNTRHKSSAQAGSPAGVCCGANA